ncbi:hypothetical protein ACLB9X_02380 [Streptomyces sp. 5K101]|uniref:hypothetical protein n=1 Tax=Streptomyces sp. 5K101 TaxID=3390037 RepID=UPI003976C293
MTSALVVGVQQQPDQLIDGSTGARDVAGDGRSDPVPVLGRALTVRARITFRPSEPRL